MLDKYKNIVDEFNTLKNLNTETEAIYSNISFQTTQLAFQYNEIIEEKDKIILEKIINTYNSNLSQYNEISKNIVSITIEYEKLIIEMDFLYKKTLIENQEEINRRYSNISKNIVELSYLFNDLVEDKDDIVGQDITTLELRQYKTILVSDIIARYNQNVIEYSKVVTKAQSIIKNGPIVDTDTFYNLRDRIENLVIVYNINKINYDALRVNLDNLVTQYNYVKTRTQPNLFLNGPMINVESYNYFENKIKQLVNVYNNTLEVYNTTLINNLSIIDNQINTISNNITELEESLVYNGYVYKIRLFSIFLNVFLKHFRILSYNERWIKLNQIKQDYLQYLKDITTINSSFIVSLLHPIYLTPILMYDNRNEPITLKDNISQNINLNNYYGCISPDLIKYTVRLLDTNIRENIKDSNIDIFNLNLDGTLHFNPDYRGVTYDVEIQAFSSLKSQITFIFNVSENNFPPILTLDYNNTIKLGRLNDNQFLIDFKQYYSDSNLHFMVESENGFIDNVSNLDYDDILTYKSNFINGELPLITDIITITPYMIGYPVLFNEYTNMIVSLNVISVPKVTIETITVNLDNREKYYYTLDEINRWYIKVDSESIINIKIDDVRENLKDSLLNPVNLNESNILQFNPDYRGESYNVTVNIETFNSYTYCNIINFNVIESSVPKPLRLTNNLLLEHLLIRENYLFNLNNYFISMTGENLEFNVIDSLDGLDIKRLFTLNDNKIQFTPDDRNIEYTLQIYAIDTIYNVKSDDYLEIKIREDKVLNKKSEILPLYELGNEKVIINVYDYIRLPNEKRYKDGLRYSITYDSDIRKSKKGDKVVTIDSEGLLTLIPDFRNITYNIKILIESYEYLTYRDFIEFTFNVSEREIPYPTVIDTNIVIENIVKDTRYDKTTKTLYVNKLDIDNVKINLNYFFKSDNAMRYEIIDNIKDNIYNITNNILNISPDVRDVQHIFSILAIDNVYNVSYTSNNVLNIVLTELPPLIVGDYKVLYNLSNQKQYINLDDIFKSVIKTDLLSYYVQYSENYDIRLNLVDLSRAYTHNNNLLTLNPDYRGIDYRLTITALNVNYFSQTRSIEINVVEEQRREVERLLDKMEINLYSFNYTDSININLEALYNHLTYYLEYELRLLNMDGIELVNSYIDISLGYLSISKVFDLDFSFYVVLYDLVENVYLMDKAIVIRLLKSKEISILFKDNEISKDILIGDIGNNNYEIIGGSGNVTLKNNNKLKVMNGNYKFIFNLYDTLTGVNVKQYYYNVVKTI